MSVDLPLLFYTARNSKDSTKKETENDARSSDFDISQLPVKRSDSDGFQLEQPKPACHSQMPPIIDCH